jgi:hypothetical protein
MWMARRREIKTIQPDAMMNIEYTLIVVGLLSYITVVPFFFSIVVLPYKLYCNL